MSFIWTRAARALAAASPLAAASLAGDRGFFLSKAPTLCAPPVEVGVPALPDRQTGRSSILPNYVARAAADGVDSYRTRSCPVCGAGPLAPVPNPTRAVVFTMEGQKGLEVSSWQCGACRSFSTGLWSAGPAGERWLNVPPQELSYVPISEATYFSADLLRCLPLV